MLGERMAHNTGRSKSACEHFVRSFFSTLKEALQNDNIVKIKGFGTFKLVVVNARESINISTGQRVSLPEYNKITFTPDKTMKDKVNRPFSQFASLALDDEELQILEENQREAQDNSNSLLNGQKHSEQLSNNAQEIETEKPEQVDVKSLQLNTKSRQGGTKPLQVETKSPQVKTKPEDPLQTTRNAELASKIVPISTSQPERLQRPIGYDKIENYNQSGAGKNQSNKGNNHSCGDYNQDDNGNNLRGVNLDPRDASQNLRGEDHCQIDEDYNQSNNGKGQRSEDKYQNCVNNAPNSSTENLEVIKGDDANTSVTELQKKPGGGEETIDAADISANTYEDDAASNDNNIDNGSDHSCEKKRRSFVWILWLILVLIVGAGGYTAGYLHVIPTPVLDPYCIGTQPRKSLPALDTKTKRLSPAKRQNNSLNKPNKSGKIITTTAKSPAQTPASGTTGVDFCYSKTTTRPASTNTPLRGSASAPNKATTHSASTNNTQRGAASTPNKAITHSASTNNTQRGSASAPNKAKRGNNISKNPKDNNHNSY